MIFLLLNFIHNKFTHTSLQSVQRCAVRSNHQWSSKNVRSTFIEFFRQRDHRFVPSSSVIPKKNEGSYFVNAGMNQFKPLFLGTVDSASDMATYRRVVNSQKCIRIGGKHNDLEDVGFDTYHHTFFEMLGNWSFADYFKKDACQMAWDLLTKVYRLPASQLFVTYFGGNEQLGLKPDLECRDLWMQIGVQPEKILSFGMKDNFWSMGDTGPCGPCTEIHFDRLGCGNGQSAQLVNSGSPDLIELWNIVFMQFDRQPDGSLHKLRARHIDTGMGLERLVAVLQGKSSNYDTDLFHGLFTALSKAAKCGPYRGTIGNSESAIHDAAYRIVADHARMFTVAIADGLMPGRRESEAKLKHVIYRCLHQAYHVLRAESGLIAQLVPIVIESLGESFPELNSNSRQTVEIVMQTEQKYLEVTTLGRKVLQKALSKYGPSVKCLSGEQLWEIQEGRFGKALPADITRILASEFGITVDMAQYETIVQKHNEARVIRDSSMFGPQLRQAELEHLKHHQIQCTDDSIKYQIHVWSADGYKFANVPAQVVAILSGAEFVNCVQCDSSNYNSTFGLLLDRTSFYASSGGQIADIGSITSDKGARITVHGAHNTQQYVLHSITLESGKICVGDTVVLSIDQHQREGCMLNHTATHVLNYALNKLLGGVRQCGSMVGSDRLTFDFTCVKASVSDDDLLKVTTLANDIIQAKLPVFRATIPLEVAKGLPGIVFMADEVYPSEVHVVSIGVSIDELVNAALTDTHCSLTGSVEPCGGTHVENSGHLEALVITNFQSSLQGTKRLTAITGKSAIQALENSRSIHDKLRNAIPLSRNESSLHRLRTALISIEQSLSEGLLLARVDRSQIRHEVEKLMRLSGISEQQNRSIRLDLQQELKTLLLSYDGCTPIITELGYSKIRDMLDALVHSLPTVPLLLLSKANAGENSVLGIAHVPKNCDGFTAENWMAHICALLPPGSHSAPRGKHARYADTIHVCSISGSTRGRISSVAEDYIMNKLNIFGTVVNTVNKDC